MEDQNHSERAHAKYSPSSASRNMTCTAAVPLTEKLISEGKIEEDSGSSLPADRGTFLHELAELKLRKPRTSLAKLVGKETYTRDNGDVIELTKDMVDEVTYAVTEAKAFMKQFPAATWDYEVKMASADGIEDAWGTADIFGFEMGSRVIIADFKFGKRPVSAVNNTQFKEYGRLGAQVAFVTFTDDQEVVAKVIQPAQKTKFDDFQRYDAEEMRDHIADMKEAVSGEEKFSASESNCMYCQARGHCTERGSKLNKVVMTAFKAVGKAEESSVEVEKVEPVTGGLVLPPPAEVPPEMVQHFMAFGKMFQKWFKEFSADAYRRASGGEDLEGMKLVVGRKGNRKWAVPDIEAINFLQWTFARQRGDVSKEVVLSVTEAAKIFNDMEMSQLMDAGMIKQDDGKATLALADDKRKDFAFNSVFKAVGK